MRIPFETTIEKVARIIARQYNIDVKFEGNGAYTDGKTIVLPSMSGDLAEEFKQDLMAYCDHEVAHCKFTEFDEVKKIKNRFHKELLNATEDVRIEALMGEEFPGSKYSLDRLNDKLNAQVAEKIDTYPWPIKLLIATNNLMTNRATVISKDIEDYIPVLEEFVPKFQKADSTKVMREQSELMMKRVMEKFEEEVKEKKEKGKEKTKSGLSDADIKAIRDMMSEMIGDKKEGKSEYDSHVHDIHSMMDKEIAKEVKGEAARESDKPHGHQSHNYAMARNPSIPITTRYDVVHDFTRSGDVKKYNDIKREIMKLISPIKQQLERVLKVKENARWKLDREAGKVNSRSLAQLVTDKNFRKPFKEFVKVDTKNVAVEILIDMSGSMSGEKIAVARKSAIAMSEALKMLGIKFEVTGFTSVHCSKVQAVFGRATDQARYNRRHERLDLYVFKSFESDRLFGLEKLDAKQNNPDGECVKWAAERLMRQKEKRKILFVLSDGMPCADGEMKVLNYDLKHKVAKIMQSGIECVGLGILTDSVKHFYPDYVHVKDLKSLPAEAMRKICHIIMRG